MHRLVSLSFEMDDQQALCRAIGNPQKVSQFDRWIGHLGRLTQIRADL